MVMTDTSARARGWEPTLEPKYVHLIKWTAAGNGGQVMNLRSVPVGFLIALSASPILFSVISIALTLH
jgi:hypothetical protein